MEPHSHDGTCVPIAGSLWLGGYSVNPMECQMLGWSGAKLIHMPALAGPATYTPR
jgi:hypothetical protein